MNRHPLFGCIAGCAMLVAAGSAGAALNPINVYTGHVGLSVDGVGSTASAVGNVQANIPVGATVLQAYLYSAGVPFPFYADAPKSISDYNAVGITLAGTTISNFDTIVGATSTRADIGRFYTGRADVTSLVRSLAGSGSAGLFNWAVTEGNLSTRIDGEVLAIVYSLPSLPNASVVLLDGGQNTGGETTTVNFAAPIGDPTAAGFVTQFGIADSFSCCGQQSTIKVNGATLTTFAGNNDDGAEIADGSLITAGGIGDVAQSAPSSYETDHELYNLAPFLHTGDSSFSIFTSNATNDDNIFFANLYSTATIATVNPAVPEPETYATMLAGLAALAAFARRRKSRA